MESQAKEFAEEAKPAIEDGTESASPKAVEASHEATPKTNSPSNTIKSEQSMWTSKTILLMVAVFLSLFLVALDRTIISTAVPQITDDFKAFTDVGWYGSAYLLTCCALQLLFGKVYTFFSVKATILASTVIFEVGSALCGAAPNSVAFIIGRALAGVGAAGIFSGVVVCIAFVVPLEKRPQMQGMFGALMGIAAIAGPLIGGGFTSNVTWRWCFYINLPIGGIAMVVIFLFLDVPDRETTKMPLPKKLVHLDGPGTIVIIPGVVSLLLALQWGGQTYSWSDGRIIALFTLAGVLMITFGVFQVFLPTTATLPPRIFKQRSVVAALWLTVCIQCGNYIIVYFLPIWFQAVTGVSASESGIRTLPLMLSMVFASITGGFLNTRVGYYTPLAIVGSCVMSVGAGLITTLEIDTSEGRWIGYQIIYGLGLGYCFQVPNLAVQTCLPKKDMPVGLSLMLFGQLLGAAVFVSVGENVLANELVRRLLGFPGFEPSLVTSGGVTLLLDALPADSRGAALIAYNEALRKVFQVGLIPSCLSVLGAFSLEWRSIKKKAQAEKDAEAAKIQAGKKTEEKRGEEKQAEESAQ